MRMKMTIQVDFVHSFEVAILCADRILWSYCVQLNAIAHTRKLERTVIQFAGSVHWAPLIFLHAIFVVVSARTLSVWLPLDPSRSYDRANSFHFTCDCEHRIQVCVRRESNVEQCIALTKSMHDNNSSAILNDFVRLSDVDRFSWSNQTQAIQLKILFFDFVYFIYFLLALLMQLSLSLLSITPIALLLSLSAPEVLGFRFIIYFAFFALLFSVSFFLPFSCAPHVFSFIREFNFRCSHNYGHVSYTWNDKNVREIHIITEWASHRPWKRLNGMSLRTGE